MVKDIDRYFIYFLRLAIDIGIITVIFSAILWFHYGFNSTLHYWWGSTKHRAVGTHFSTIIIYIVAWVIMTLNLLRQKVSNIINFCYCFFCFHFMIGSFEWIYLLLYAICHDQWWAFRFLSGTVQDLILLRNTYWTILLLPAIWLLPNFFDMFQPNFWINFKLRRRFKLRLDRYAAILTCLTIAAFALWIFYPWPHQIVYGQLFPQTCYFGPYPGSHIVYDYIESDGGFYILLNNGVHAMNILAKLSLALTMTYILTLKELQKCEKK